jgi:MFS family permease
VLFENKQLTKRKLCKFWNPLISVSKDVAILVPLIVGLLSLVGFWLIFEYLKAENAPIPEDLATPLLLFTAARFFYTLFGIAITAAGNWLAPIVQSDIGKDRKLALGVWGCSAVISAVLWLVAFRRFPNIVWPLLWIFGIVLLALIFIRARASTIVVSLLNKQVDERAVVPAKPLVRIRMFLTSAGLSVLALTWWSLFWALIGVLLLSKTSMSETELELSAVGVWVLVNAVSLGPLLFGPTLRTVIGVIAAVMILLGFSFGSPFWGATFLNEMRIGGNLPVHFCLKQQDKLQNGCLIISTKSDFVVRLNAADCDPRQMARFWDHPNTSRESELRLYPRAEIAVVTFDEKASPAKSAQSNQPGTANR